MTAAEAPRTCDGHDGYRHEAFFYEGAEEFMAGVVPFIRAAVAADEPILVVLGAPKIAALREALGADAERVLFADMAAVGDNPARIIPAWQQFLDEHGGGGRPMRGIGEPIWAGRTAAELVECQRHEALLNIAFADPDFWLLCPYDIAALPIEVLDEARRSHPFLRDRDSAHTSMTFAGPQTLAAPFDRALPEPPADAEALTVNRGSLGEVRAAIALRAAAAGLSADRTADLVLTVNELTTNSVRHGGGYGTLHVWADAGAVVCEVRDQGRLDDPLAGRVAPSQATEGGRGLWIANQVCDLVQIRSFVDGVAVRVHQRLG
jgi:anti-sigma regulatory factor (Ser/Thr protein kinase)